MMTEQPHQPRICMPSGRNLKKRAWLCGHYESQDVLADVDHVNLVCVEAGLGYGFRELWQRRLMYRDVTRKVVFANPGLQPVHLDGEYELFIARCQTYKDLLDANAIKGWKDHCRVSVCWIDEMWAALLPEQKYWVHALREFDFIFIGCNGTVEPLSQAIGRQCHYLPGAVDVLRFTPYFDMSRRVIDICSLGRRRQGIHNALLALAKQCGSFYMYDTFVGSQVEPFDHKEHREHLSDILKRSKYFVVAPGKFDCNAETAGQVEVGHRYFEGAAAGTVMIGEVPRCRAFDEYFPWPDAVVELAPDGSDTLQVLHDLVADPGRISAISHRNAIEALLHHDWVYRWKEIFRIAGVPISEGMVKRERLLHNIAEAASQAWTGRREPRSVDVVELSRSKA